MKKSMLYSTIVFLFLLCLWDCGTQKTVPEELAGVWRAKNPNYKGSFLSLQKDTISFGTVGGDVHNFTIVKIKKHEENGDWESYIIHYLDNNSQKCELPIYFHPINDGILRLKNKQEITWFRDKSL